MCGAGRARRTRRISRPSKQAVTVLNRESRLFEQTKAPFWASNSCRRYCSRVGRSRSETGLGTGRAGARARWASSRTVPESREWLYRLPRRSRHKHFTDSSYERLIGSGFTAYTAAEAEGGDTAVVECAGRERAKRGEAGIGNIRAQVGTVAATCSRFLALANLAVAPPPHPLLGSSRHRGPLSPMATTLGAAGGGGAQCQPQ